MSLLPDNAGFHERVQDCFVAYRGRGVSLSADDLELVDDWAATGVPFEVVARGIRKAAEAALWDAPEGEGALRSLRACRRSVDSEIAKYLKRAAGKTEPTEEPVVPFHVTRHQKLCSVLKKLQKAEPATHRIVARLLQALTPPADFAEANRQEELAVACLIFTLTAEERRTLLRAARRMVEKAPAASASARRESLRFHRAALVRHRFGLPTFW